MAKRGGTRGHKARDKVTSENMQAAAAGEAPRLNLPQPKDLKHHYDTITGYKSRVDEAQGHYRNAVKAAEEAGVDTQALLFAMRKSKKDPMVLRNFFAQLREHMREQGQPFQLEILDAITGDLNAEAYNNGFKVATAGGTPNNPYPPGTKPFKRYARGVAHGIGKNLGQTIAQVDEALGDEDAVVSDADDNAPLPGENKDENAPLPN